MFTMVGIVLLMTLMTINKITMTMARMTMATIQITLTLNKMTQSLIKCWPWTRWHSPWTRWQRPWTRRHSPWPNTLRRNRRQRCPPLTDPISSCQDQVRFLTNLANLLQFLAFLFADLFFHDGCGSFSAYITKYSSCQDLSPKRTFQELFLHNRIKLRQYTAKNYH